MHIGLKIGLMKKSSFQNVIVILNPVAGKGTAINHLPAIKNLLAQNGLDLTVCLTEAPGHAAEIAQKFAKNENTAVIAAGGDGTCNEVINGLMQEQAALQAVFGVLPLGRGNDFSYGCGIPQDIEGAIDIIRKANISPLDVGLIRGGNYPEGRFFGNGVGVGFDTMVGLEAAKMPRVHDSMAYVFGALKTLIKFSDSPVIEVSYNGKTVTREVVQISLMNGSRMGGVFFMAPAAVNNDGKLDLCMVDRLSRTKLMKTIVHYTKGSQNTLDWVSFDRAEGFSLKAVKGGMVVHADGETICIDGKQLEISCLPAAINMLRP